MEDADSEKGDDGFFIEKTLFIHFGQSSPKE